MKNIKDLNSTKIIAVGLNYHDHAKEMNAPIPKQPLIFLKSPSAIIYDGDIIRYPQSSSRVDYEAELAVIIRKECKNIKPGQAKDYILGYTCANDVTARDLQKIDGQWTRAKSFDTFCPIGPRIVKDIDPDNLSIRAILNGEVKQDSNTNQMIFKVDEVIAFVSEIMTLFPDDIIITGTPAGIGPMERGDMIEIEIEGIGILRNPVV